MKIELDLETATDEQIKITHLALHKEAFKRGMILSNMQPKGTEDAEGNSPAQIGIPFKSIEKL